MPITLDELNAKIEALAKQLSSLAEKGGGSGDDRFAAVEEKLTKLAEMADSLRSPSPPPTPPPSIQNQPTQTERELTPDELRAALFDRPDVVLDRLFRQKTAPVLGVAAHSARLAQRLAAQQRYKDWDRFEKEIAALEEQVPPYALAHPGAYDLLYNAVKGSKADELIEEERKKAIEAAKKETVKSFSEGSGTPPQPKESEEVELSPEEEREAARFKMSKEEWRKFSVPRPIP